MPLITRFTLVFALLLGLFLTGGARAAGPVRDGPVQAELVSELEA